ncbi:MAG TPA: HypC/HybG/HupF family hydrogenase formation chaperone [bacterium]|nr:HypC/HybG/HupF family hydrogenase formation chaperone [bacterium]HPP12268.1 HypC/HybG/HupF family hydrogenase formation chaperone [bacterium]
MCLAVPMKLVEKKGEEGVVELAGVRRKIRLDLVDNVRVGDYLIVHAGFAIEKLNLKEAKKTLKLFQEIPAPGQK